MMLLQIVSFCNRMIRVFSGLEAEASKCRLFLTVTLLQLELGDVVAVSVEELVLELVWCGLV